MGARSTASVFDFSDVFATMFGSEASGGEVEMVTCQTRDAGESDGLDGKDVELWESGCIVYRPAAPSDKGKCQVLIARMGSNDVAIASRDLRAMEHVGALNEGDAAFVSPTGGGMFRANHDTSVSMLQRGEDADAYHIIEKDGTHLLGNKWGAFELGAEGWKVTLATGEQIILGGGKFQILAPQAVLGVGSVALGIGAVTPLAFVPINPAMTLPPGTPAFAAPKPILNIFTL